MKLFFRSFKMATFAVLKPPQHVKGMTSFSKEAFCVETNIPAIKFSTKDMSTVLPIIRNILIRHPKKIDCLRSCGNSEKIALLQNNLYSEEFSAIKETLRSLGVLFEVLQEKLTLGFDNWSALELIRAVLPNDLQPIRGFSQIGHIIHLNLKAEHLKSPEVMHVVGQILLEKIPPCKTVVNKVSEIDNEFRNFKMQLLAGESNFKTSVKEQGFQYKVDLNEVFWNPKLSTEHHRLVKKYLTTPGTIVYDIFAGVGPFAIPAASKGSTVIANDLNHSCKRLLEENAILNKTHMESVTNLDAQEFITSVIGPDLLQRIKSGTFISSVHAIMNLPGSAVNFLPKYLGILGSDTGMLTFPFCIHCYTFSKEVDFIADAKKQVSDQFAAVSSNSLEFLDVHGVRNVAPGKEMVCVSFKISSSILGCEETENTSKPAEEPLEKKLKTDDSK